MAVAIDEVREAHAVYRGDRFQQPVRADWVLKWPRFHRTASVTCPLLQDIPTPYSGAKLLALTLKPHHKVRQMHFVEVKEVLKKNLFHM